MPDPVIATNAAIKHALTNRVLSNNIFPCRTRALRVTNHYLHGE